MRMRWYGTDGEIPESAVRRIAELEAALRNIAEQCIRADDPEHHTLNFVKCIAQQVLQKPE